MEQMSQEHTRSAAAITTAEASLTAVPGKEVIESVFIQYSCAALMELWCKRFLVSAVVCVHAQHKQRGAARHRLRLGSRFPFPERLESSSEACVTSTNCWIPGRRPRNNHVAETCEKISGFTSQQRATSRQLCQTVL